MEQHRTTTISLYTVILQDGNLTRLCWVIFIVVVVFVSYDNDRDTCQYSGDQTQEEFIHVSDNLKAGGWTQLRQSRDAPARGLFSRVVLGWADSITRLPRVSEVLTELLMII